MKLMIILKSGNYLKKPVPDRKPPMNADQDISAFIGG